MTTSTISVNAATYHSALAILEILERQLLDFEGEEGYELLTALIGNVGDLLTEAIDTNERVSKKFIAYKNRLTLVR